MNGKANGTMEELTDSALTETQKNGVSEENHDSPDKDASGDSKKIESKHDSQRSNGLKDNNTDENVDQETSESPNNTSSVCDQENSNNGNSNHCFDSNKSYPEAENSSQGNIENDKQDTLSQKSENCEENTNIVDSGESSEDNDDDSVLSGEPRADDTVSVNSNSSSDNDDTSQEGPKSNEIIILENDRSDSHDENSKESGPEVHDITSDNDNDDCVITHEDKSNSSTTEKEQALSKSRKAKRKHEEIDLENGDDESDVEEVELEDPLSRKTTPIVINDTKTLVEMAAKKMKPNQHQKEAKVVINDSNSNRSLTTQGKSTTTSSSINVQSLYQSIAARGTTVTPVSSKTSTATQSSPLISQTTQALVLPSLTDDMFVVEAPSFIVPYVYEKPSVKPFREFVDKLGKELEEQKAKEEEQKKEKRDQLRKERRERGEDVSDSEDDQSQQLEDEKKKKKADKKAKRRRRNDADDDASWDGESTSESEDEILSDEDTVVIKRKEDSIEEISTMTALTADKICNGKSDNYFDCSLGKFFMNIGLGLVQEFVQNDLLKHQNKKLTREKKSGQNTRETQSAIASLMKNLELSKENNAPYAFPQTKCEFCSFKSESKLVMNHHLETPHMKNNMYKCNFCEYEVRNPHEILNHMQVMHKVRGKLERAPACHQCCNCPFEDNGKGKLARHQVSCAKKFKPELNLAPPVEWEPPAKIPKIARARNNMVGSFQNPFNRGGGVMGTRPPLGMGAALAGGVAFRARGRSPMPAAERAPPRAAAALPRHNAPAILPNTLPPSGNGKSKTYNNLSISITPLPRQPQPPTLPTPQTKSSFVICEICDGYIKDLEQLRNHMQWIHKVRIHPKMIYNRPPLNCQKCQFRFFTDQGLERHLLGSHGLVTSSMQEAANKGKDAGRCPVCGRVYQWKLLNHVSKDHNLTLKPAHLSYKCTVCTATFGMYKQFENHVYSAHSVVAKRVMDKSKSVAPAPKPADSLKPLKINDEITIIPQPVKSAPSTKTK